MRLIDADALRERHCEGCAEDVRASCKDDPVCASLMWVVEEPTIDAEPVKHGRWERVPSNGIGGTARCSICGKAIYGYHTMNYCPNCGAKMDGGDNDA